MEPTANQLANAAPGLNSMLNDPQFRDAIQQLAQGAGAAPKADAATNGNPSVADANKPAPDASIHVDPNSSAKKLLAGKYEKAEDLEKAYVELQKKLGAGDAEKGAAGAAPTGISDELIDAMNAEFAKEGKLAEETIKRLRSAGVSDRARGTIESLVKIARDSKEQLVHALMGGSENWANAKTWAKENLPVADFQVFAEMVNSPDLAKVRAGLEWLGMKQGVRQQSTGAPLLKGQAAVGHATVSNSGEARDLGRVAMGRGPAGPAATKKLLEAALVNPRILEI